MSGASHPGQWGLCASARPGLGKGLAGMRIAIVRKRLARLGQGGGRRHAWSGSGPHGEAVQSEWEWEGIWARGPACGIQKVRQREGAVRNERGPSSFLRDLKICPLLGMGVWQFSKGPDVWLRLETQGHGPDLGS